ncbi:MAG: hypothetical protein MI976_29490 [Pseudomonadales bacterium]|nr:hypothetical protein [Pseudomonadales bacterium]
MPTPETNSHEQVKSSSKFGFGFILGIAFAILLAAYPTYVAFMSKQSEEATVGQSIVDSLQMQITVIYQEIDSIERQLQMIAEAELKYAQLVDQKFDLETNRNHLQERLKKLEASLEQAEQELGVKANQFDRITDSMRL